MTADAPSPDETIIDLARVRSVVSAVGAARFLEYRSVLEARLAQLAELLRAGAEKAPEAQALAHQCHGSAVSLGLTELAKALERAEDLARLLGDPAAPVIVDVLAAHAAAWRLIGEQVLTPPAP